MNVTEIKMEPTKDLSIGTHDISIKYKGEDYAGSKIKFIISGGSRINFLVGETRTKTIAPKTPTPDPNGIEGSFIEKVKIEVIQPKAGNPAAAQLYAIGIDSYSTEIETIFPFSHE